MHPNDSRPRLQSGLLLGLVLLALSFPDSSAQASAHEALRSAIAQGVKRHPAPAPGDGRASLFLLDVTRFFARYYIPTGGLTLPDSVGRALAGHLGDALRLADEEAGAAAELQLGPARVERALGQRLPYQVDAFGDVIFFPERGAAERISVPAADLEAIRDFGISWRLIHAQLEADLLATSLEPAPEVAEALVRGSDLYIAAVLRVAGRIAAERGAASVSGPQVDLAARTIRKLAEAAPTSDEERSPLTEPAPTAFFRDVTREVGLDFRHRSAAWLERFRRAVPVFAPTFAGGGLAARDLNGDGYDDLVFVGGGGSAVFLNDHGERLVRHELPAHPHPGRGSAEPRQPIVADFDNDGRPELLITYVDAPHRLLVQGAGSSFEDLPDPGLGGPGLHEGAATVFDYDRDGLLDIYLCGFGDLFRGHDPARKSVPDVFPGDLPAEPAYNENGAPNRLLRNRGGLRFEAVELPGVADRRWCRSVTHTDFDADGRQDLVIANDFGRNTLLRGQGEAGFEDLTEALGITRSDPTKSIALADHNGDQVPDLYAANVNLLMDEEQQPGSTEEPAEDLGAGVESSSLLYGSEPRPFFRAGSGPFEFQPSDRIARSNALGWAWDGDFIDFDNDGDDDLYVTNGSHDFFSGRVAREVRGETVLDWSREANVFYENDGERFEDRSAESGADFQSNSRAAVVLDFDRDGDLDLAINNFHAEAVLLRNDLDTDRGARHYLRLRLVGRPQSGSNRDAIGARVVVTSVDGLRVWREVRGSSGYLSADPTALHIGVGSARRVDISIRWPGGGRQKIEGLAVDRSWRIAEGQSAEREADR